MRRTIAVACVLLALSWSGLALAEDKPTVAWIERVTPKPDSAAKLEEAARKHFAWHRAQNDAFAWPVWQVMSGDNVGDLVVGTFEHSWKEFDARAEFDRADDADFVANVLPSIGTISLNYWEVIPEASRPSASQQPSAMSQVTHYFLKPSGVVQFADALKQIKTALDKAEYPVHLRWYRLVSGGEGPHFALTVERNSWAELEPMPKSLEQVIAEVTSPTKAVELMSAVRDNTRHTYSEMLVYRPDLSYVPTR